ncbi:MAG: DUF814 domain-containing protein, partial [Planctomycetes bacterium]|nr:DUF814 domain-containing protein [Planctomycetota bacterium]
LKANLDSVARGESSATLPDLYNPGRERVIKLDPYLNPLANARKYFKQYKKLTAGLERKENELALCVEERGRLVGLLAAYDKWVHEAGADDAVPENIVQGASELRGHVQGIARKEKKSAAHGRPDDASGIREYLSADGMSILVGKAAKDNDRLSLKVAKGNDWWFHVHNYAGSHVVVRMPARKGEKTADKKKKKDEGSLPQETLLDAAHLAAWFSKARDATRVEVTYTQAKYVHKRKGAPAGQVVLNQSSSILIRMEEKRMDRLLARHIID